LYLIDFLKDYIAVLKFYAAAVLSIYPYTYDYILELDAYIHIHIVMNYKSLGLEKGWMDNQVIET